MALEDLIGKKIKGKRISSPTNKEYERLALEGNKEIDRIMREHALAAREAANIWVR